MKRPDDLLGPLGADLLRRLGQELGISDRRGWQPLSDVLQKKRRTTSAARRSLL